MVAPCCLSTNRTGRHGTLQRATHRGVLAASGQVQHLEPLGQGRQGLGHDLVETLRAQGATGDQQRGGAGVQAQRLGTFFAGACLELRRALRGNEISDRRTQRQSGHLRAPVARGERGGGEGERHRLGPARSQPVGQPWAGVLLVDDHRNPCLARSQVGRGGHVSAEADHDVGLDALNGLTSRTHGTTQARRKPDQSRPGPPRHGHTRHECQLVAGLRDEVCLQPLLGAQHEQLGVPAAGQAGLAQRRGRGQQRVDVTGGSSSGQQHAKRVVLGLRHGSSCEM